MRWPAWLRPGGELAAGYDVPDGVTGVEALRVARAMQETVKATGVTTEQVLARLRERGAVTLTDDQVDRLADEAGIEVGSLAPAVPAALRKVRDSLAATPEEVEALADQARALYNPAPGLAETIAAGVPPWAEMQAKYPPYVFDREKARAAVAAAKLADVPPPVHEQIIEHAKAAVEAHYATDAGEVDFRAMLKNDGHAWGLKAQLEHVLGRPYLATALVDQLTPETAQNLADRLQELLDVRVREEMAKLEHDLNVAVTLKMSEYQREREQRAREVSNERFHSGPTRLS